MTLQSSGMESASRGTSFLSSLVQGTVVTITRPSKIKRKRDEDIRGIIKTSSVSFVTQIDDDPLHKNPKN